MDPSLEVIFELDLVFWFYVAVFVWKCNVLFLQIFVVLLKSAWLLLEIFRKPLCEVLDDFECKQVVAEAQLPHLLALLPLVHLNKITLPPISLFGLFFICCHPVDCIFNLFIQFLNAVELCCLKYVFEESEAVQFGQWLVFIRRQHLGECLRHDIVHILVFFFNFSDVLLCVFIALRSGERGDQVFFTKFRH